MALTETVVQSTGYCPVCEKAVEQFRPMPQQFIDEVLGYGYIHPIDSGETINHSQYLCSHCDATDRDRWYAYYISERLKKMPTDRKYRFIDFAPGRDLGQFLRRQPQLEYRSADLFSPEADDKVDITDMALYSENSVDIYLCSHVLEHVVDHHRAMAELFRILKPGGWGILMVPILITRTENYENQNAITEADRWKHFGQWDHVRLYARPHFVRDLEATGFKVHQLGVDHFGLETFNQLGLLPKSVLYVVEKEL